MNWSDILLNMGGLAATAFGGPGVGAMVGPLTQMLGSAFKTGGGSASSEALPGDMKAMMGLRNESAYNAAGAFGMDASRQAAQKADQYVGKNSAEGARAVNALRNIASTQLGAPQTIMDTATSNAQRELGNQRRSFMESANASGVPLAARIAGLSNLGQAAGQNLSNLYTQGVQGTQQALAGAAGTFSAADELRQKDLQSQLSMFQPYSMQLNPAMTASQMAAFGQYKQSASDLGAAEDPMALAKTLIGQGSAMGFMDPYQKATYQRQAAAQRGEDPGKYSYGIFG